MRKLVIILAEFILLGICNLSIAQSYEYSQGYIWEQKYIKRISVEQAEKNLSAPGLFFSLMKAKWMPEKISDPSVKRAGDILTFKFTGKSTFSLRDCYIEPTKDAEGDSQSFTYLESTDAYHIVGVSLMHDQPQFLLIPKTGSDIYFVETN